MNTTKRIVIGLAVYICHGLSTIAATNLIYNGDFEQGNTNFVTTYAYNHGNVSAEGTYDVVASTLNSHPLPSLVVDHTTGHGLMLMVNGSPDTSDIVWSRKIHVKSHRSYAFTGYASSWGGGGGPIDPAPPRMRIRVNGQQPSVSVPLLGTCGLWQNFTAIWNAGTSTSALLEVNLESSELIGNDITLDDLAFCALTTNACIHADICTAIEVHWNTVSGKTYQVQWSTDLVANVWFDFGHSISSSNIEASSSDALRGRNKRF